MGLNDFRPSGINPQIENTPLSDKHPLVDLPQKTLRILLRLEIIVGVGCSLTVSPKPKPPTEELPQEYTLCLSETAMQNESRNTNQGNSYSLQFK
jgi:hypothetical protein